TKNPVLGIGNKNGEAAEILRQTGLGDVFSPEAKKDIEENLLLCYNNWIEDKKLNLNEKEIGQYSRENLTSKLSQVFFNLS
ncbi:MAG: hypothetical protein ACOCWG_01520, partial [bacterium]